MSSYSSILKGDESSEVIIETNTSNKFKIYNFERDLCRIIKLLPKRKDIVDWLMIMPDNNKYHYDYCVDMFKILKIWMDKNKFSSMVDDEVLLAKFISILFITSNKKEYF